MVSFEAVCSTWSRCWARKYGLVCGSDEFSEYGGSVDLRRCFWRCDGMVLDSGLRSCGTLLVWVSMLVSYIHSNWSRPRRHRASRSVQPGHSWAFLSYLSSRFQQSRECSRCLRPFSDVLEQSGRGGGSGKFALSALNTLSIYWNFQDGGQSRAKP